MRKVPKEIKAETKRIGSWLAAGEGDGGTGADSGKASSRWYFGPRPGAQWLAACTSLCFASAVRELGCSWALMDRVAGAACSGGCWLPLRGLEDPPGGVLKDAAA